MDLTQHYSIAPADADAIRRVDTFERRRTAMCGTEDDMNHYYMQRARAAHAAAEAADDPRDAAAFKAAAATWERLAKPRTDTWSMEPSRQQLAALKRDAAEAPKPIIVKELRGDRIIERQFTKKIPQPARESAWSEYASSGIEF